MGACRGPCSIFISVALIVTGSLWAVVAMAALCVEMVVAHAVALHRAPLIETTAYEVAHSRNSAGNPVFQPNKKRHREVDFYWAASRGLSAWIAASIEK